MKKNTLIYLILLIVIVTIITAFFFFNTKNEIKDSTEISQIISDSNLEILLNLGDFNQNEYSDEKILQVAMLLASEKGYMNESTSTNYFEYVPQSDIHSIINELTGIIVEAPIQIEDFYYQYDSENEFYYLLPSMPPLYTISQINHVHLDDNIYIIESVSTKKEDGKIISEDIITTKLKLVENNSYINYQIIEQTISK